ncbi:MAG: NAD(+) synthase [Desulfomonilia bacterium]|jgi:NAD+ synthase (glutamine-hydrolysing)|nr:NAD(+) synthase [Desulfomonilia bacterium]HPW68649.1 NAD(+) synthase [Deltaproteobacteria bacterium]
MKRKQEFFNIYRHGFVRVAACKPEVRVSDPAFNAGKVLDLVRRAHAGKAVLAVFPELCLSAYSNEDLFFQEALLRSVEEALLLILRETVELDMVVAAGAPCRIEGGLYNCGVVMHRGRIMGIAVKSYLPNYREFYEARQFRSSRELPVNSIDLCSQSGIPIGADLVFRVPAVPGFRFFVEICEDLWSPVPPSSYAALAGATLMVNLSASNIIAGKDEYRHELAASQSARCISGYIYTAAGFGESTTDLAWDGHALVYENGNLVSESKRFSWEPQVAFADLDLDRLTLERIRMTTFHDARTRTSGHTAFRDIILDLDPPGGRILLEREICRFPYVPLGSNMRDKRCFEVYNIQVQGLAKRMKATGIQNLVIGVSGGLDSTHALIVCARAMDELGLPRTNIKAFTMPGFATSRKTYLNACDLMAALKVEAGEIDIRPGSMQMMQDIGHPYAGGEEIYDVTFENIQAGQRTSVLFRLANHLGALVVGTGDLSELALGWSTYGVGDHMSHYNVNASVPKTLIQYLIRWVADRELFGTEVSRSLKDILSTEISPELVPGTSKDQPAQSTEKLIGPYELQDFNIFYLTRYGYLPSKVAFLSWSAWHDREAGAWPDVPEDARHEYSLAEIKSWLRVFIRRFFKLSQYKRSCVPNGPKVGSGGSLSPRGDYRAPSDSEDAPWMADLDTVPEE